MCGIAGFSLAPGDHDLPFPSDIAAALLLQIQERGKDATGVAWTDRKGTSIRLRKDDQDAADFVLYGGTEGIGDDATAVLLHTRWATQGSPAHNVNNHPIKSGHVVGVHNGHLENDDELFADLRAPRKGEVDSEAAFALLSYGEGPVEDRLTRLEGRASLAWLDKRDVKPVLHLARVNGSPLALGQSEGGSLFFASTMKLLEAAMDSLKIVLTWTLDVAEGVYLRVRDGQVDTYKEFEVPKSYVSWWNASEPAAKGKRGKGRAHTPLPKIGDSKHTVPRSGGVTPYDMEFDERTGEWGWDGDDMTPVKIGRLTDEEFEREMSDIGGEG